jgi:hypothetical protein
MGGGLAYQSMKPTRIDKRHSVETIQNIGLEQKDSMLNAVLVSYPETEVI